ncbi:MAG: glutathione S-transferase C-terminal domain-containing protein [Gammaproteobacteria bacterium]
MDRGRRQYGYFLEALNTRLEESEYIAGPDFSIADITGLVTIDFARRVDMDIPGGHTHTRRWYDGVAGRPCAGA